MLSIHPFCLPAHSVFSALPNRASLSSYQSLHFISAPAPRQCATMPPHFCIHHPFCSPHTFVFAGFQSFHGKQSPLLSDLIHRDTNSLELKQKTFQLLVSLVFFWQMRCSFSDIFRHFPSSLHPCVSLLSVESTRLSETCHELTSSLIRSCQGNGTQLLATRW